MTYHHKSWCDHIYLIRNTTVYCCKDCGMAIVKIPKKYVRALQRKESE